MAAAKERRPVWRWALAAIMAGALLLIGVIHTPPVQLFLLKLFQRSLAVQGVNLQAASLSFNLLRGTIRLDGVAIGSFKNPGLPQFASVESVEVDFTVRSLLSGKPRLNSAHVKGLRIHYVADSAGRDNLPRLTGSNSKSSDNAFYIGNVSVTVGIEYEDRGRRLHAQFPQCQLEFDSVTPVSIAAARFRCGGESTLSYQQRSEIVDSIAASGSLDRDRIQIASFKLSSGASNASLAAAVTQLTGQPQIEAAVRAHTTALPIEGSADAVLRITGPLNQPTAEVSSLTFRSKAGELDAQGTVSSVRSNLTAQFRHVDLSHYARLYKAPVVPAAKATGTLKAQWLGFDYRQAAARITATLTPAQGDLPIAGNFIIDAADGAYRVTVNEARAVGVDFDGQVAIARDQHLSGNAAARVPDLEQTLVGVRKLAGANLPALRGNGQADLTFGGTLSQPSFSAAATLQHAGMTLQASIDATAQRAQLNGATLTFQNRTVATASGTLIPLQINAQAGEVPLPLLLDMAAMKSPVEGSLTASLQLARDSGSGHVTITGLTAYKEALGQLDADVALKGSSLNVTNASLRKPAGGELRAEGTYNLDDAAFRFTAHGNGLVLEGLELPSGTLRGHASVTLKGEGSGSNRQIDATISTTAARWDDFTIGRVEATANLLGDGLTASVKLPDHNAAANARMSIEAPYPAGIEATLTNSDLKWLPLDPPIGGAITATVEASGDLDRWQDADMKGEIAAITLERNGANLKSAAPAKFALNRRTATLQPLTLTSGKSSITVGGHAPVAEGAPPADLHTQGNLTAEDAKTFLAALGNQSPAEVRGAAKWDLSLRGPWRKFVPAGQFTLTADSILYPELDEVTAVTATAAINAQSLEISQLSATWNHAPIEGKGSLPLALIIPSGWLDTPATAPGRFQLNWKNLDLAPILRAKNEKLGGLSAGEADIEIKGFGPRDVAGRITLNPLDLRFGELGFSLEQPASLSIRNGVARVDQLNLKGTAGTLSLRGEAGLLSPQPIRLQADGNLDSAILASFSDQITTAGGARLQVLITGTASTPAIAGFLEATNIDASLPAFNLQAEDIKSRIDFNGDQITLTSLTGTANGGALVGSGNLRIVNGAPQDIRINLTAANVYLEYPRELKMAVSAALALRSTGPNYTLSGDVQVLDGAYNENINFDQFLLRGITETSAAADESAESLLRRIRFNIGVRTVSPVLVNNNLGKAAVSADLKLLGTYSSPGLSGRLMLEEGGELRLNERTYLIERGAVTFTDERRIRPTLDILARTQVSGHEITLQVQGEQGAFVSKFTSDPPLPESDVIALLVTGRTLDRLAGSEADVTKEQVLSYLANRVGGELTRTVERTFGLSQVRIQPNLIAAESDPGARLTVGQDISSQLRLTYSMDLAKSNEQLWLGEYDVTRRFRLRGFKDFDNTYRFEFRHDIQFGAIDLPAIAQPRAPIRKIGKLTFAGNFYLNEKELAQRAKLKPGRKHDFFAVRKAVTRIEQRYQSKDFHEARVRTERETGESAESTIDLLFRIREGPQVNIAYEGWTPPSSVRKRVVRIWQQGVFDTGRIVAALSELRGALLGEGYLQPLVTHHIRRPDEKVKQVLFEIHPGAKYERPEIVLQGAARISPSRVRRALNGHRPKADIYLRPQRVAEALTRFYRSEGYLEAVVSPPKLETTAESRTARLIVPVQEGPQFSIAAFRFSGAAAVPEAELRAALKIEPGEVYRQDRIDLAIQDLVLRYSTHGYNDAEIETIAKRGAATVDIEFRIDEGRQARLKEVLITGNRRTSSSLVRHQAGLHPGDIVNPQKFSEARRNLYATGAFSLVEIETGELENPEGQKLLRATISVRELTPFALKYGGFYDTERGFGAIFDFVTRNYLRSARVAGVRVRYDSQLQEVRGYFSQPLLRRLPLATTSSIFFRREIRKTFVADRTGISIVQEARFKKHYILNYGYRFEKTHTYDRVPDEFFPFDITLRVAPLQMSLTREYRDDILDATRGSFVSQSLEYAPKALGSELRFLRYYGQYFHYLPLTKPSEIPWSSGARRPRVIYAGAIRLGVAKGLDGQDLVPSERFYAGGGNSLRGFEQDVVGPLDRLGSPTGGNALFLMNHELRFPAISILEGVGFVDTGNVFRTASELRPWNLRTAAGLGLRLRTPYFLFRFDYGVNVSRKPGEPFGKFFFSIGQSF